MDKSKEYYESLDKRTKEYKDYLERESAKSEGLGDTIDKITTVTGIKSAVKFIAGEDCGCDERKTRLNKAFGYRKPECMTEEEFKYMNDFLAVSRTRITGQQQLDILRIYNRIFHDSKEASSCYGCMKNVLKEFDKLLRNY
jgi:hypothetical protein